MIVNNDGHIEIYWEDLSSEAQRDCESSGLSKGNFDAFPLATITPDESVWLEDEIKEVKRDEHGALSFSHIQPDFQKWLIDLVKVADTGPLDYKTAIETCMETWGEIHLDTFKGFLLEACRTHSYKFEDLGDSYSITSHTL